MNTNKKAIIYCVCNKATKETCDECFKYKKINPDHTLNYENWEREQVDIDKLLC